jgi:sporulation protein YabP
MVNTEFRADMPHSLSLDERHHLTVTGVSEVLSFDEEAVVARTDLGILEIQGNDLKLKTLSPDGGQVHVEGRVSALIYEDPQPRRAGWRRFWG